MTPVEELFVKTIDAFGDTFADAIAELTLCNRLDDLREYRKKMSLLCNTIQNELINAEKEIINHQKNPM